MMDLDEFDSLDYDAIFGARAKATGKGYGNREDREARLRAERRAGLSPKQRERIGAPPKKIVNFRDRRDARGSEGANETFRRGPNRCYPAGDRAASGQRSRHQGAQVKWPAP